MSDTWNNFKKLNTLSIDFANNLSRQATIFANSNNQVELLVTLSIEGTDGNLLWLSDDELKEALYLCNYRTGEKISDPWIISFEENDYNRAVSYENVAGAKLRPTSVEEQANRLNLRFYLSCKTPRDNGLIAVGVHVPGVGDFDTTEYGTNTKNGPRGETGGPFKNPKYVNINLLSPIDYSDAANLKIEATNFFTLENNFTWSRRRTRTIPIEYEDGNGISIEKRTVYLKPSGDIHGNYFLKYKIECDRIQNSSVSSNTIDWRYGESFSCFNLLDDLMMDSCAVIGAGHFGGYQTNIWLVEHCVKKGGGTFTLADSDYEYVCFPSINDNDCDINSFEAKLVCYKVKTPIKDAWKYGWNTVIRPAKLTVTDLYGNHGTTTITFDDHEYFDVPLVK